MTRYDKKTDLNQKEIVAEFRKIGYSAIDTHCMGGGFPDILVTHKPDGWDTWISYLVEIKNGRARHTPAEVEFMEKYPGLVITVRSIKDVQDYFG